MKVVISGSFRRHLSEIIHLKEELESYGIEVIKPNNTDAVDNPENPEFIKFKGEENIDEQELQEQYFCGIRKCDAHIIYNKDGYIGKSALYELFYGAGTNSFSKSNLKNEYAQVYLIEPLNYEQLKNNYDEEAINLYYMINALIKMGYVKVGLNVIYDDFEIKKVLRK